MKRCGTATLKVEFQGPSDSMVQLVEQLVVWRDSMTALEFRGICFCPLVVAPTPIGETISLEGEVK
jgi:hypothetical protein